jgi:cystathionine gamma-synthase
MGYHIATKCLYGDGKNISCDTSGALSVPIYQSATFAHKGLGESSGYDYSRLQNPTREQLEKTVAALENGVDALAFSSGMAAITALMELFKPGNHVIADSDLYGGSTRLFDHICQKNGITFSFINCSTQNVEDFITDSTKAVFVETPTNPMMRVVDIQKTAEITKRHGILLIVDNTFLSPYFQNPLALGADIVVHSGTKYLGGHNDTLAGFVVTSTKELSERMRFIIKTVGSGLAPIDSWLILRGIKTLPLRMERSGENAKAVVEWLLQEEKVTKVYYPGIPGSESYEICKKQARGFGAMVTFEVESKELAERILRRTRLIHFAESLGGVETLITYPITQTHADVPKDVLAENGITERILRMSVGIEDKRDLLEELAHLFGEDNE